MIYSILQLNQTNHTATSTLLPNTKTMTQAALSSQRDGKYYLGSGQQPGKVEKAELAYGSDLDSLALSKAYII